MSKSQLARLVPLAAAFLALLVVLPAEAQSPRETYVVKFLCGFTDGRVPRLNDPTPLPAPYRAVEPGNYGTVINIINFSLSNNSANLSRRVHVEGSPSVGMPSVTLQPDQVQTIDCGDVTLALAQQQGFQNDGRFVEGYLIVSFDRGNIPAEYLALDVTAAYSYAIQKADNSGTGLGSSLQVVRIDPRIVILPE